MVWFTRRYDEDAGSTEPVIDQFAKYSSVLRDQAGMLMVEQRDTSRSAHPPCRWSRMPPGPTSRAPASPRQRQREHCLNVARHGRGRHHSRPLHAHCRLSLGHPQGHRGSTAGQPEMV